jgi:hypothetical protein
MYLSLSFQLVVALPVQEQRDSLPLPAWPICFLALSWTPETATAFAPVFSLQNMTKKQGKLQANGKPWWVLDSSFLLLLDYLLGQT